MPFREYTSYDGLGLAELVAKGEVTASELVEEAIVRIEKHNPTLNAVIYKIYDEARGTAKNQVAPGSDGRFPGVPFLLKDILGDCKGVPTTSGCRFFAGLPAPFDAELVVRYRRAGLIPLGKTNAPELGILPTTEPQFYGPSRNPWNTLHSTGGSSGGSAAAVAAGIVPIAHANDGGGSIRIPAACCGLVGLKPTRARNPLGPLFGDLMSGLVSEHVLTRTVRDSAAVLDCTAGPDVGDPYWAPPPERPYLEEVSRDPGRLRLAYWSRTFPGEPVHPDCVAAVEKAARLCEGLGHEVAEGAPPVDMDQISGALRVLFASNAMAMINLMALVTGRKPSPEFSLRAGEGDHRSPVSDRCGSDADGVPADRCLFRELRRLALPDARGAAREARHHRRDRDRPEPGHRDAPELRPLHAGVQHDGPAGRLASTPRECRRTPHRCPRRRKIRR